MLKDGQLIHFRAAVVQQSFDQFGIDRRSRLHDRVADDLIQLITGQGRNEKLRRADGFRKPVKPRAIADEIRAHRQHDPDIVRLGPARFQQELNELCRLLACPGIVCV